MWNILTVNCIADSKRRKSRKTTQTENRLSGQNHKNANSQTKDNKAIIYQITVKNVSQAIPTKNKERKTNQQINKQIRNNEEQIEHQNPEKRHNGVKK